MFVALLNESREAGASFDLKRKAQDILSEDFLSPVVGAMLYPDLVQRILPLPVAGSDRAKTLEEAWEHAWEKHVPGRNRMREPFLRLWENRNVWTPALLLNATWVETIAELEQSDPRWERVERTVIHISNEPVDARFASDSLVGAADNPNIAPGHLLNEAFSPLFALLNTRNARGFYARESAAWAVGHENYLHFGLCASSANAPLGWVLASSTRRGMDAQLLKGPPCGVDGSEPIFDNPRHLETIGTLLARPASKTGTDPIILIKDSQPK